VLALGPGVPDSAPDRILEIGAELNARYAVAIGMDPDPVARARAVADATREFLSRVES
jgi:hypothetical protein